MSAAREGTMSGHAPRPLLPAPDTGLSSITEADRELPPPPPGDILQGEKYYIVRVKIRAGKFLYRYQECIDPGPESNILMDHFLCFLHFDPVLLNFL